MKRPAFLVALPLVSALCAPALAGETFTFYHETTVQEQKFNRMGSDRSEVDLILGRRVHGQGNHVQVNQEGRNHRLSVRQTGRNSTMRVLQKGDGATADVVQTGSGKVGFLFQFSR